MIVSRRKYLTGFRYKWFKISLLVNTLGRITLVICPSVYPSNYYYNAPDLSWGVITKDFKFPLHIRNRIQTLVALYDH